VVAIIIILIVAGNELSCSQERLIFDDYKEKVACNRVLELMQSIRLWGRNGLTSSDSPNHWWKLKEHAYSG